jgi:ABC-type uncharacterized transport system permease subunit
MKVANTILEKGGGERRQKECKASLNQDELPPLQTAFDSLLTLKIFLSEHTRICGLAWAERLILFMLFKLARKLFSDAS